MQEETVKTEKGYRAVKMDSSSSLKDFSIDRKKYYRKYVLQEEVTEKDTQAIMMGQLVETLLWEPELFDEKFYMSACATVPTAGMLKFVEAMYVHTKAATDESGQVNATFLDIATAAYADSGYKIKLDAVIKKFDETDAKLYFEEICIVRTNNLDVVDSNDVNNAEKIVAALQNNPITADIVNRVSGERYTILDQHKVFGYEMFDHFMKSMMDRVEIDHVNQTIQVYDLKCTWNVEDFYWAYYLKRRTYIQALSYFNACRHMRDTDPALKDYKVLNPRFIVCDSINYYSPLIYTLSDDDMFDAKNGFSYGNRDYPGVTKIISDLKWAIDKDVWNISKSASEANGVININHDC